MIMDISQPSGPPEGGTPNIPKRSTMNGKPVFTVPSKTIINFESGFKPKLLCDGPTFSAGTACTYNCSFCYVPDAMRKQMPWLQKNGVIGAHEDVVIRRRDAAKIVAQQLLSAKTELKAKRLVIYASPLVDVAGNMDLVRETVEICKVILTLTCWDIRLLSKSNLLPQVARALRSFMGVEEARRRLIFGVSTGTLDDKLAAAFEEGCPLVSKRLQSLRRLQDEGFRTFGMICPSLPQRDYDAFAHDMARALIVGRCEHTWAEVINVRGASFTRTVQALRQAGYEWEANQLEVMSRDKTEWENYARETFQAHAPLYRPGQLRFMQYVTKGTREWWEARREAGAVVL